MRALGSANKFIHLWYDVILRTWRTARTVKYPLATDSFLSSMWASGGRSSAVRWSEDRTFFAVESSHTVSTESWWWLVVKWCMTRLVTYHIIPSKSCYFSPVTYFVPSKKLSYLLVSAEASEGNFDSPSPTRVKHMEWVNIFHVLVSNCQILQKLEVGRIT